jgi:uncharacterized damage-inducible protein DinB
VPPYFKSLPLVQFSTKKKRPLWEDASNSPQVVVIPLYNNIQNRFFSCADYTIMTLQGFDMTTRIEDLIVKMEGARNRLNTVIEQVTPHAEIYPAWSLKQLLDHITGWDDLLAASFRAHSRGETPIRLASRGIDQYNDNSITARKELSLESSRKAYDEARLEILQVLHTMPPEKRTQKFLSPWGDLCSISSVIRIFISHEMEHADHIEERLLKAGDIG